MYVAKTTNSFSTSFDSYQMIQDAFDSDYRVEIPAGNYYISQGLEITRSKSIKMYGSSYPSTTADFQLSYTEYYNQNQRKHRRGVEGPIKAPPLFLSI